MNKEIPILVTRPDVPSLDKYTDLLKDIWDRRWLTNDGYYHRLFEQKLAEHLGVKYVSVFNNGTVALLVALQALDLKGGEIITTPYSFVATANSIIWNRCTPVFADVDPVFGNLDPLAVEELITDKTVAIMPVHVYGNPCDVDAFDQLAKAHNLKLIYDAAHAFGTEINGDSVLNRGNLSVLSFHATKVFNTVEGGAIVSHTAEMKKYIDRLKNFGFAHETEVDQIGINGKQNEILSAFGLLQLENVNQHIGNRCKIAHQYKELLSEIPGIDVINQADDVKYNFSYFPILVNEEFGASRDELYNNLKENNIFSRRYFYPLITDFEAFKDKSLYKTGDLSNAKFIADRVICLPMFSELNNEEINRIVEVIRDFRLNKN